MKQFLDKTVNNLPKLLIFLPGIFLFFIALSVLFAPRLLLAIIAVFFIFAAVCSWMVALKILEVRRKINDISSKLSSRVIVQGFTLGQSPLVEREEEDPIKKILLH